MDANTIQTISSILAGSGVIGLIVNSFVNRNKSKAEQQDIMSQVYGRMVEDCRSQVNYLGDQVTALQKREIEWLQIIRQQQQTEAELRKQIKELERRLNAYIKKQDAAA